MKYTQEIKPSTSTFQNCQTLPRLSDFTWEKLVGCDKKKQRYNIDLETTKQTIFHELS